MNEKVVKHLEMIQAVVTRMASNSFMLKGWTVTLVAAIFTLSAVSKANPVFFVLAFFPILVFWGLDSYYLKQERMFRVLYDKIRVKQDTDFSMKWNVAWNTKKTTWWNCLLSVTELWFYVPVLVLTFLLLIYFSSRAAGV